MLLANPQVQKMLKAFLLSQVGTAFKSIFWGVLAGKLSSNTNPSQSGQAGAVPQPDTAPLTGAPHEDGEQNNATSTLEYVDSWNAKNFKQHTTGSVADIASDQITGYGHGSNGTPYDDTSR